MKKTIKKSYRFDADTNRLQQLNLSRAGKKTNESAYIRELIHQDYMTSVGVKAADIASAKRQLIGIGTNINQIARKMNAMDFGQADMERLSDALLDVASMRDDLQKITLVFYKGE